MLHVITTRAKEQLTKLHLFHYHTTNYATKLKTLHPRWDTYRSIRWPKLTDFLDRRSTGHRLTRGRVPNSPARIPGILPKFGISNSYTSSGHLICRSRYWPTVVTSWSLISFTLLWKPDKSRISTRSVLPLLAAIQCCSDDDWIQGGSRTLVFEWMFIVVWHFIPAGMTGCEYVVVNEWQRLVFIGEIILVTEFVQLYLLVSNHY